MKRLISAVVAWFLLAGARGVLARYKPKIVMVTGSVGKTSAKDAAALALSARFLVRKSEKSFNSEFGVPFTVFGLGNPWADPIAWLKVILRAAGLLVLPNHYPNMLVLEVGADKQGDLAKILKVATPDAVVVTRLPEIPVHVEFYATPEQVREEEFSPCYALAPGAPLVVSADDPHALTMAGRLSARLFTYGESAGAMARLSNVEFAVEDGRALGMRGVITLGEERAEVVVRGAAGRTQLLPLTAAVLVARAFDIPFEGAIEALRAYEPPAGRGRLLAGVNGSTLIDDSHNASPAAVEGALETLKNFPHAARRVAILGDMLELGRYSVMEHERIGVRAAEAADLFVAVGIRAKGFAEAARAAGMGEDAVLSFDDARAAAAALPAHIRAGDVVLTNGSQSIRMERITAALLADPADREKLPRQERAWLIRP